MLSNAIRKRLVTFAALACALAACSVAPEAPSPQMTTASTTPPLVVAQPADPTAQEEAPQAEDSQDDSEQAVPSPQEPPKAPPANPALGGYYRWVDAQGVTHMVDNPALVPREYRAQAAVMPHEAHPTDGPSAPPAPAYAPSSPGRYWSMEREAKAQRARERQARQAEDAAKRREQKQNQHAQEASPVLLTPAQIKANYEYWMRARGKKP